MKARFHASNVSFRQNRNIRDVSNVHTSSALQSLRYESTFVATRKRARETDLSQAMNHSNLLDHETQPFGDTAAIL